MIAMKTSKYERELKRYEENKPKIDSLNALKISFGNNKIDAATYGKNYLMATKGAAAAATAAAGVAANSNIVADPSFENSQQPGIPAYTLDGE